MGCSGIKTLKENTKVIWIDPNIDNEENKNYVYELKLLLNEEKNVKTFKDASNAIDYLKSLEFDKTVIISNGGSYPEFIKLFKKNINEFKICPKIIIFTENKENYLEKNLNNKELLIDHHFYISGGIKDKFEDVRSIISIINRNRGPNKNEKIKITNKDKEVLFNIEYINDKNQLIMPLNLINYIKPIDESKIEDFNKEMNSKYSKTEIEPIFRQLLNINEIPYEIISKFWLKAYTYENPFYIDMNKKLENNEITDYLIYIQMMYEGIKLKSFPLESEKTLYLGAYFNYPELRKMEQFFLNEPKFPRLFIYSKSFASFFKTEKEALKVKNNVLLILEDLKIGSNINCVSLKAFSSKKEEVLFFPFSCFEIKKIERVKDGRKLYLNYLENNKNLFEGKKKDELFKEIPKDSKFAENIFNLNILEDKYQNMLKEIISSNNN